MVESMPLMSKNKKIKWIFDILILNGYIKLQNQVALLILQVAYLVGKILWLACYRGLFLYLL